MSTERFTIKQGSIWCGKLNLGPADALHVDYNELVGVANVIHHTMPHRIDGIMAVDGKVIGIESKKPADLLDSFLKRRLKRQFRTLRAYTDQPVLLIRGEIGDIITYDQNRRAILWDRRKLTPLFEELARWQVLGAVVLHGPVDPYAIPGFLDGFRKILGGGRNALVAVAGTDQNQSRERAPGWLLRRIPGLGAKTSTKLLEAAGTTQNALTASPKQLAAWGMNKAVIKAIEEAMK